MNRSFLVTDGTRKAVLKIDDTARRKPRSPRAFEAQLQSLASRDGLAGAVLYHDDECYLSEFIEGSIWTEADLHVNENLESLGIALRRLHALPASGRRFDAAGAARHYAKLIAGFSNEVELRIAAIDSVAGFQSGCFCHNDLVAGNIVATPDVQFIDWEYACDNDPLFDLATVIGHHDLAEPQTEVLMQSYAGDAWRSLLPRLQQQLELYKALLWLWRAATSCF